MAKTTIAEPRRPAPDAPPLPPTPPREGELWRRRSDGVPLVVHAVKSRIVTAVPKAGGAEVRRTLAVWARDYERAR
jgi:hypothetical protein